MLPFPSSKLNPNRKGGRHWAFATKLRKTAKQEAYMLTRAAGWRGADVSAGLKITFYTPDKRRRDNDNMLAALKPALDGVALGIGVDDSNFNPLHIYRKVGRKDARVEIERLGGDDE